MKQVPGNKFSAEKNRRNIELAEEKQTNILKLFRKVEQGFDEYVLNDTSQRINREKRRNDYKHCLSVDDKNFLKFEKT